MIIKYVKMAVVASLLITGLDSSPALAQKALIPTKKGAVAPSGPVNIVGSYRVLGKSPGQDGQYEGTLTITKTDQTYQVTWTMGQESNFGTGLLQGDTFAVAYTNSKGSFFGLVLYKIVDGGQRLSGVWTMAGANLYGEEQLTRLAQPTTPAGLGK